MKTEEAFRLNVARDLKEELKKQIESEVKVDLQKRIGKFYEHNLGSAGLHKREDIIVSLIQDWSPPELDTIDGLKRWFPNRGLEIPVAVIETRIEHNPQSELFGYGITDLHAQTHEARVASCEIVLNRSLESTEKAHISELTSEITATVNKPDIDWAESEFLRLLTQHIEGLEGKELISDEEAREMIDDMEPSLFHFNETLSTYKDGRDELLIILLSVYFEYHVSQVIHDFLNDLQKNGVAGDFYKNWNFATNLQACRYFSLLEEDEFRIIDAIRNERNNYAHNLEKYHGSQQFEHLNDGDLEHAIRLYEEILGVRDSMLGED